MVRIRREWLVVVLGAAFVFAACKKDDKKADPAAGAGDKVSDKAGDKPAEMPSGSGATDDVALLPVDSEVVMGVNVAQLFASPLWKQLVEPKLMTPDRVAKLNEFKEKCGFDVMTAVKSVSFGIKASGSKPDGVVVLHGIEKSKAWDCADKMKDEMAKEGTEFKRDGDVALIKDKQGETTAVTFVNNTTAVAVLGEKATPEGIKAVTAGNNGLKSSQQFTDLFGKVKSSETLWLLINGKLLEKGASMGVKANAIYGSVNVTDGLSLDMRVRTPTPEDATAAATLLKGQSQTAAQMVDKIDVTNDGNEVKISMAMSGEKLKQTIATFGGMFGAMGGMGHQ